MRAIRQRGRGFLDGQLESWRRHAAELPDEIEELASRRRRVIWEDGEDITEELLGRKRWQLHCLLQLIEIAEEDAELDAEEFTVH